MKPTSYFSILLFAILFLRPVSGHSQATFGLTGGVNISDVNFENAKTFTGYYGGLRAQIPIEGHFSLISNLLYSLKGWHFEFEPNEPGGTMNLHYLDLQLAANYALNKSFSVDAGIEIGRLLKTKRDPDVSFFDDYYQKGDFSALVGLHYKIWKTIGIDVKYLHGLNHLAKGELTDINGNVSGEFKEGSFRVFQVGISTDIIKCKSAKS